MKEKRFFLVIIIAIFSYTGLYSQIGCYYSSGYYEFTIDSSSLYISTTSNSFDSIAYKLGVFFNDTNDRIALFGDDDNAIMIYSEKIAEFSYVDLLDTIDINRTDIVFHSYGLRDSLQNLIWSNGFVACKLSPGYGLSAIQDSINAYGGTVSSIDEWNVILIECQTIEDAFSLSNCLFLGSKVIFSEPDFYSRINLHAENFNEQYYLNNTGQIIDGSAGVIDVDIDAPEAWTITMGSSSIKIAVIDDGVENHEDLVSNGNSIVLDGYTPTLLNNDGSPESNHWHGQSCAGIIGAQHNTIGFRGVAPGCKIIPIRIFSNVLDPQYEPQYGVYMPYNNSKIARAINKAWDDYDADILSCSYGGFGMPSDNISEAFSNAMDDGRDGKGSIVIASSGNFRSESLSFYGVDKICYPAALPDVISVGAINKYGVICEYSQRGPGLVLVAPSSAVITPSGDIRTIDREGALGANTGNYTNVFGGTSAACPQVAGVAALILSIDPTLSMSQVTSILRINATDYGDLGYDDTYGYGLVNAHLSVLSAYFRYYTITGQTSIDNCQTATYTLSSTTRPAGTTLSWETSNNLVIVSGQGTGTISVKNTGFGDAWVKAMFTHEGVSYSIQYDIQVNNTTGYAVYNNYETNTNLTISTSKAISGTFTINSPNIVTITSTVYFTPNAKIIVKPGAKLIVNGGTLTSLCNESLWQGIYVHGNSNLIQTSTNQGTIELLNNAIVENSICAIRTWDGENLAKTGGIIKASNTTFVNNVCAIEFKPYVNHNTGGVEISNVSYFNKCTFTVNDNNFFSYNYAFNNHVSLWGVNKIPFKGCNFKNERSFPSSSTGRGKGINSTSAGFIITESCPGVYVNPPCTCSQTPTRSTFQGLSYGVYASNSGSIYSFTVSRSDFSNNYVGIYNLSVNNFFITLSNFDISTYGNYNSNIPIGIFLVNCTGFTVEENNLYTTYTTLPTSFTPKGIYLATTGTPENSIYRNSFEKLHYGIQSAGVCGENLLTGSGLQFNCNYFTSVPNNISVLGIIKSVQGTPSKGADNDFSITPSTTIYSNYSAQNLFYHYSNTGTHDPQTYPLISSNISKVSNALNNSCSSTLCDYKIIFEPKSTGSEELSSSGYLDTYANLKYQYETLLTDFYNSSYDNYLLNDLDNENSEFIVDANSLLEEINSISKLMADISDRNIYQLLSDSILNTTELQNWYDIVNTPIAKYLLVNNYCSNGDFDMARSILMSMPSMFEFDSNEFSEYSNFMQFFLLRETVSLSGRNLNQLTSEEISQLESIGTNTNGLSSGMANSILCFFYNICHDDIDDETLPNLKGTNTQQHDHNEDFNASIFVYPNPAKDKLNIVISYRVDYTYSMKIIDISGRIVFENVIHSNESTLDISNLNSGVYYYVISNNIQELTKGKFIKN